MEPDHLKSAWEMLKLQNTQHHINGEQIFAMLDEPETSPSFSTYKILANTVLLFVIMLCCQGG
ncbi:hypothetical protein [Chondrinema litorale]|uniref:hypothetical protein n=1 Tax=Chondrinema litorale TaxID=2994555 RepID=UPI002542A8E2|nr:hypothetical protein [Chondrinema litorale]UZR99220.1 hypothetical protein OQ292_35725 [Chondrinema litorale]